MAVVAGEITTTTYVHIPDIVRGTISAIGYTDASFGFDVQTCAILTTIDKQSGDIAMGVDKGGAGDQGMMFGYASNETPSLMPLPIVLAHRLAERLSTVRKAGDLVWLRPDGKTQVSVIYEGARPVGISKLVVSTQHSDKIDNAELREGVIALVVRPCWRTWRSTWWTGTSSSTRPVASWWAARKGTPASPAGRSSSTPTAGGRAHAAAPSAARTLPRSTAPPATRCAGWPRTSWRRSSRSAARRRWPTRSASPSQSP